MGKRPAFQFYPSDWRTDPELGSCTLAARGLWVELMCLMHEADPYGHLLIAGEAPTVEDLARLVREAPAKVRAHLAELERKKVFSRTEDGVIYSRRMVRDERVRNARATGGSKSLQHPDVPRPKVKKGKGKDVAKDTLDPSLPGSLGGSPSSSSSASATDKGTSVPSSADPADAEALTPGGVWMWEVWQAEFGRDLPGLAYTKTRREKLTGLFNEQLRTVDDPRAELARMLRGIRTHPFWGDKPRAWKPEVCLRSAERREEVAVGAPASATVGADDDDWYDPHQDGGLI